MELNALWFKPGTLLTRLAAIFERSAAVLRTLAEPVDTWLADRQRSATDYQVLAGMSDRELNDIGVSKASVRAIAEGGWTRDEPCQPARHAATCCADTVRRR